MVGLRFTLLPSFVHVSTDVFWFYGIRWYLTEYGKQLFFDVADNLFVFLD